MVIFMIGDLLRTYRLNSKLSLKELSALTGITDSRLSRIENDTKNSQSFDDIINILNALNVPVLTFLCDSKICDEPSTVFTNIEKLTKSEINHIQNEIDFIVAHKEQKNGF